LADAPVILAAIGLAHDLGNPPFGHQGEAAIGRWFKMHEGVFTQPPAGDADGFEPVPEVLRNDFLKFEGNAQTLRLLARLQTTAGPAGLNLTAATLAALMKYTVSSSETSEASAATKKFGYFASEADVVGWIRNETGLGPGQRHPLTWLMEACDDTAYSILDVEDAIKKDLVSPEDLRAYISSNFRTSTDGGGLVNQLSDDFKRADETNTDLPRIKEIKASYLRTRLIERVLTGAADEFIRDNSNIRNFAREKSLLECDTFASELIKALKKFARIHAYNSPGVLQIELKGANVIEYLMDRMWLAISSRKEFKDLSSKRTNPKAAYVYSRISGSYRWHFEHGTKNTVLPVRYHELQLLTDMISGMTDGFACDLFSEIAGAENA
jgi:dGTPase